MRSGWQEWVREPRSASRAFPAPGGTVRRASNAEEATPGRFDWLIDDLDSETFAVRENAHKTLEELGAVALPVLREALEKNPSAERRRHVEKLLQRQPDLLISPKELRQLRALHALEQIGSPATQQLLQHLAEGAPAARLTREAKAALNRLAKR